MPNASSVRRLLLLLFPLLLRAPSAMSLTGCTAVSPGAEAGTGCCRTCTTGKACGDSCISSELSCSRGAGCACDSVIPPDGEPPQAPNAATPAGVRRPPTELSSNRLADRATCKVSRIVDGDTFVCEEIGRVRLLLVDAPERGQGELGSRATAALGELLPVGALAELELDVQQRDRYGRILAYVYDVDGRMVNAELALRGYVVVSVHPPNVRHVEIIRAAAADARQAGRGLWSTEAFTCEPADFRGGRCR